MRLQLTFIKIGSYIIMIAQIVFFIIYIQERIILEMKDMIPTVGIGTSVTTSMAVTVGGLETLNQYAPAIGLILSGISIILAVIFFVINHRRSNRDKEIKLELLRLEVIREFRKNNKDCEDNNGDSE